MTIHAENGILSTSLEGFNINDTESVDEDDFTDD